MVFFSLSFKAIRIHLGPDIKVDVPSEARLLVEQLMEMLKQGEVAEHQVGAPNGGNGNGRDPQVGIDQKKMVEQFYPLVI